MHFTHYNYIPGVSFVKNVHALCIRMHLVNRTRPLLSVIHPVIDDGDVRDITSLVRMWFPVGRYNPQP